ncbi:MAG TPA: metalloregulator ArsR/SmtB family transcription factor [Candidatus Dormibacteraeota bacterium]|nr:metalloregulator ArsR/SmtB family transcription factor [Candidatus Dormibacteraeota bacterium]
MDPVLGAIAERSRRAILRLVAEREMSAGEIAGHFPITRPAVSQHLTVLREAGLIAERRAGTRRFYRLRPEGLAELRAFLGELWPDALDRFKAAAEAGADHATGGGSEP